MDSGGAVDYKPAVKYLLAVDSDALEALALGGIGVDMYRDTLAGGGGDALHRLECRGMILRRLGHPLAYEEIAAGSGVAVKVVGHAHAHVGIEAVELAGYVGTGIGGAVESDGTLGPLGGVVAGDVAYPLVVDAGDEGDV